MGEKQDIVIQSKADFLETLPSTIRAFVAIKPEEHIVRAIAKFIEELRPLGADATWVKQSNLHLTLRFLGDRAESSRVRSLCLALERVCSAFPPFEVSVSGVGALPNLKQPRVVWCGLKSGDLISLAEKVEQCAREVGFDPEERPFAPHLTLARLRSRRGFTPTAEALAKAADKEFGRFRVTEVMVFRSQLSPYGAVYTGLFATKLTA